MHNYDAVSDAVWHKHVPLKVSICAWRLLRNPWPTKDNLMHRGVISIDSQFDTFWIILHNLLILQVTLNSDVLFCNLSGCALFG
jgi:hypothetical protein